MIKSQQQKIHALSLFTKMNSSGSTFRDNPVIGLAPAQLCGLALSWLGGPSSIYAHRAGGERGMGRTHSRLLAKYHVDIR